jgi:hypothetical protein
MIDVEVYEQSPAEVNRRKERRRSSPGRKEADHVTLARFDIGNFIDDFVACNSRTTSESIQHTYPEPRVIATEFSKQVLMRHNLCNDRLVDGALCRFYPDRECDAGSP